MTLSKAASLPRRDFLSAAAASGALAALAGCASEAKPEPPPKREPGPSPVEALAEDHGLLSRILLVYDESMRRLETEAGFDPLTLVKAAGVMREYIEGSHLRFEEEYIFPRFQARNDRLGLIETLRYQHRVGRKLTGEILDLGGLLARDNAETRKHLAQILRTVVRMYVPHHAREDTDLFPFLRYVVTPAGYDALGEDLERERTRRLGTDGFERFVGEITYCEQSLGIYDLAGFASP